MRLLTAHYSTVLFVQVNQAKRVRKDLKVSESKAPEDLQDLLVNETIHRRTRHFHRSSGSGPPDLIVSLLASQVPKARADRAARVLQGDLEIQELLVGLESLDPSALLDLPDTATRTHVWVTMLEVRRVP